MFLFSDIPARPNPRVNTKSNKNMQLYVQLDKLTHLVKNKMNLSAYNSF